ncbi:MAG: UDP-N-acetylglucosamine--N-acetylmuramyl-(pentapeptide) pyrophosphoryl-undecaprenol N-acetylglucosamine transferase [Patescibacteria group bacterium]|mgnify:CR=1 FL=1
MLRILFTGGGTGGHIYPILAVAEELKNIAYQKGIKIKFRYIGAPENYRYFLATNGILVSRIFSAKWRRYFDIRNLLDIPLFILSIIQAFWKVFFYMPNILFSKGGTGSFPVVLACWFYRIPIIVHESDSVPGRANELSFKYAYKIGISFKSTVEYFKNSENGEKLAEKTALIGNPIRLLLLDKPLEQMMAKKVLGINPEKKLILIIGGSQGAAKINDFFIEIAPELIKEYAILHQTGIKNFEEIRIDLNSALKTSAQDERLNYRLVPYFEKDLSDAYSAADLIISRSGSSSIFEIAAFGKPAILIPLPENVAANDHQRKNAYEYAKTGAAIIIEEDNLNKGIFMTQIKKIFGSPDDLDLMSKSAKSFSKTDATKKIAEEIIKSANT